MDHLLRNHISKSGLNINFLLFHYMDSSIDYRIKRNMDSGTIAQDLNFFPIESCLGWLNSSIIETLGHFLSGCLYGHDQLGQFRIPSLSLCVCCAGGLTQTFWKAASYGPGVYRLGLATYSNFLIWQ